MINSSLGENVTGAPASDHAGGMPQELNGAGPRIGDPGKRMLGAALGVRHPGLGPRNINGNGAGSPGSNTPQGGAVDQAMRDVQKAMGSIVVEN
jgi:hypothetical protein